MRTSGLFLFTPILICVILIIVGAAIVGCIKGDPDLDTAEVVSSTNINDLAIEYMEQKYSEKFEYSSAYGDSFSGKHQLLVKNEFFPGQDILVCVDNYKSEDKVFSDNFLAIIHYEKVIEFVKKQAEGIFKESVVYFDIEPQPLTNDLSKNSDFYDYLSASDVPLNLMVEVRESNFTSREQVQQFAELLGEYGCSFYMSIVFVRDIEFGSASSEMIEKKMVNGNYVECAKVTRLHGEINVRWLEKD